MSQEFGSFAIKISELDTSLSKIVYSYCKESVIQGAIDMVNFIKFFPQKIVRKNAVFIS